MTIQENITLKNEVVIIDEALINKKLLNQDVELIKAELDTIKSMFLLKYLLIIGIIIFLINTIDNISFIIFFSLGLFMVAIGMYLGSYIVINNTLAKKILLNNENNKQL